MLLCHNMNMQVFSSFKKLHYGNMMQFSKPEFSTGICEHTNPPLCSLFCLKTILLSFCTSYILTAGMLPPPHHRPAIADSPPSSFLPSHQLIGHQQKSLDSKGIYLTAPQRRCPTATKPPYELPLSPKHFVTTFNCHISSAVIKTMLSLLTRLS